MSENFDLAGRIGNVEDLPIHPLSADSHPSESPDRKNQDTTETKPGGVSNKSNVLTA
jgi:hypothetical protein